MSEYLLAGDDELTRLQLQARVWAESAETLFDHIGILPGWSAVDLGCGAMGVLGPLLQRVGTDGYVVGVDGDAYLLQAAAAYLLREGLEAVDLRHGDATQTMLDAASFDVVHARFLFPHIPQPQTLLDEMMRLARPGGIIIAQEPDHSSWHFYPRCPEWPEAARYSGAGAGAAGRYQYRPTHLRHFPRRRPERFARARCGCRVTERPSVHAHAGDGGAGDARTHSGRRVGDGGATGCVGRRRRAGGAG